MANNKKINPGVPLLDTKPKKDKKVIINMSSEKEHVEQQPLKEIIEDTTPKQNDEVENLNEEVNVNDVNTSDNAVPYDDTNESENNIPDQFENYRFNLQQEISKGSFTMNGDGSGEAEPPKPPDPTSSIEEPIDSPVVPPPPIFTGSTDNTVGKAITFNHTTRHDGGIHF